ncbi:TPA: glutamate--tRNA ligase, partial [Candidatus Azambacteria bacterium]|nr:glutamate--tRNA ligase [Candidatus Azambacteria bacterium]
MPTEIIKSGEVRVRIAPSPTGPLHIGTARTALFNFLFAKKHRGTFILRIEDTDLERSDPKYEKDIVEHLKWLGIAWDEGVEVGGEYAPYRQSERIYTYSKYVQKLLGEGKAFYCFHSKEELGRERQDQLKAKQTPIHLCEHRGLPERKIKDFMAKGNYVIRFVAPKKKVIFQDLIHGEVEFDTSLFGDFSIAKEIGVPLYNFAAAVDDFEMKISHVIRGEDHISNTPKQILIQEALDFPRPKYAHLPLILNPDRSKLSKRYLETSMGDYRAAGYLPEALVNFMVFLGWSPGTDREIFSLDELVEEFGLEKVQKSGAVFNVEKLDWFNGHYVRQKNLDELAKLCLPYLSAQAGP